MSLMKNLGSIVSLLETYRGRDRVMRIITYAAMFMGSDGRTRVQKNWKTVVGELSAARVILRLFDDLPMLFINLSTGFGLKEKRPVIRILNFMCSLLYQGFFPLEHIAWLRQKQIISGEPGRFLLGGLFIWVFSLVAEILKSLLKIHYINVESAKLLKQKELDKSTESDDSTSSQNEEIKKSLGLLLSERRDVYLGLCQSCCDFTNAVSWLPPGILWSGMLNPKINGVVGFVASFLMLYRNWPPKKP